MNKDIKPLQQPESASTRLTASQSYVLVALVFLLGGLFLFNWHVALIGIIGVLTLLYFTDLLFSLFLIVRSFTKKPEFIIPKNDIRDKVYWPSYTILCPLYKEWAVIPQFIKAMANLDYPKDHLQVLLLLEEDDKESQEMVGHMELPQYFRVVVVPDSQPKTKPKACNYGLQFATGSYVVIYDAEDIPDKDQLKKTVLAFQKADPKVVCIQAKLNFYNPKQNVLTRLFTAEYSLWFDLILTGLQSLHAPIPLGGTSNHFKTRELLRIGAWDSYNVTEDADLGIRLSKHGYQTAIVDSTTHEEATSGTKNWINQRSRWIKGYIQTYFVHTRAFKRRKGARLSWVNFGIFMILIGGKTTSMLINPLMWVLTLLYFVLRAQIGSTIDSLFPAPVFYMALFSLIFGNFLYFYYYLIGLSKRGYGGMHKFVFLLPIYWLLMSYTAYIAIFQFIYKPFHWAKTAHGNFKLGYLFTEK